MEAKAIIPYIVYTLLPTLDMGSRLKMVRDKASGLRFFGPAVEHRLAVFKLRRILNAYDPCVPDIEALTYNSTERLLGSIFLKGYSKDAEALYEDIIEDPADSIDDLLSRLENLDVDHDERVIVPWRAFAVTSQPADQKESGRRAPGKQKPTVLPHTSDPYLQFKDKHKYAIPQHFNKWCKSHGWNSNHTTESCRFLARQKDNQSKGTSGSSQPRKNDQKQTSGTQSDRRAGNMFLRDSSKLRNSRGQRDVHEVDNNASDDAESEDEGDVYEVGAVEIDNDPINVPATINGVQIKTKFDIGACVSVISEPALAKVPNYQLIDTSVELFGAGDEVISIGKAAKVDITLPSIDGKTVQATALLMVIRAKRRKVLIGRDLLRRLGYLMNDRLLKERKKEI
ncbi:Aspartyl protease [Carpediemonas membranifera]|uniref:Aspartyl protease n=1 Tax=Carpediemonas membranifera TaxID=201153 RepID=A0A8J6B0T1_9EUKA|nr:Aspartyl protease [Carpediemonas membranifera]|eukprot:KAG9391819.1 Aspartyl protease [Carpediemonas membranifera]